ncbi:MAG: intermembrane phospholipid transport protein YdbH family protein [Alcanivorax sp.]
MKKVALIFMLLFMATLSGGCAYAYFVYIPQKVEQRIVSNFDVFGFEGVNYANITHKSGQIIISDIALDKDKFSTIERMDIGFSLFKYLINPTHAQNITIHGLKLTGDLDENNTISLAGLKSNTELLKGLQSFPAGTLTFDKSSIDILTPTMGGISLRYNARATINSSGEIEFKTKIDSKQKALSFHTNINGSISPEGVVSLDGKLEDINISRDLMSVRRGIGELTVTYPAFKEDAQYSIKGEMQFPSLKWNDLPLRGTKLSINKSADTYEIKTTGDVFGETSIPWTSVITPQKGTISSETTLTPENLHDVLNFIETNKGLSFIAEIPDVLRNLKQPTITIQNTTDINASKNVGTLRLSMQTPKISLNADYRSADDINTLLGTITLDKTDITSLENENDDTKFNVSASGEFSIKDFSTKPHIEWFINSDIIDGIIDFGAMKIPNINGSVFIGKNKKRKTKSDTYLPFALPLKSSIPHKGRIGINLSNKDKPLLGNIRLKIYNGEIRTESPISRNGKIVRKNKLIVSDLNISALMRDAGFSNVKITGALGGIIPFETIDSEVNVNGALIQSLRPGVLSLPKDMILGLFPGTFPKMVMIREALENYHYEFFEIRFDGDLADRVMMTVSARGQNPNMARKEPVDLNLQIETQISLLFEGLKRKN